MAERVYVIVGKDESLVGARCQELLDELLAPEQRMTGLSSLDGEEAAIADVLDELRTTPFLTDRRVVVVRGADSFVSKHRDLLEKYFEKPAATGILVLTVAGWDARTRLAKMLPKVGALIELTPPPRWKLPDHLVQHAAGKHQIRLNKDAAELLIELTGEELAQLYNEVEKLTLFARGEKVIRVDHVEALIGHHRMYDAFEVIDAMIAGQAGQAVTRLRHMFAEDKAAEYTAVGAFAFHLRRMFQAKALLEKRVNPVQIAKQLRIWSNKDRFFAQLQRISLAQIAAFLEELAALDHATKTGQAQTPVVIEQLVLRLAGSPPVPQPPQRF
ncbi:MAG: DNA polymerase III subunit delta [Planctomycetes bacterium]|jgi:DNA polymerase-3 subunit delta|nr:DNA polymerase III subunit delta [Planctomycetota bacterium]